MNSPLMLFRSGPGGLPPATALDFAALTLPASPNTCLAGPPDYAGPKHLTIPPFPQPAGTVWARLNSMAAGRPRTWKFFEAPERRQGHWVERSATMNFPDIIIAEVQDGPTGGAVLLVYSHSLFGWSDLGVNRKRVEAWVAALGAALAG
jgi:uncharacterized protein (DUF1499 family)